MPISHIISLKMKTKLLGSFLAVFLLLMTNLTFGQTPPLGTASNFVLFNSTGAFDNTGASIVTGDIGSDIGTITGFPNPGTVVGNTFFADPTTAQAAADIGVLYGYLAAYPDGPVHNTTIVTETLTPNCYGFGGASTLDGDLTLDAQGNPDALFIFKVNGAFATSVGAHIILINGASLCNVYWQINGQFVLGQNAVFMGNVVSAGAISLLEGASLIGRGLTTQGAITLQNNVVSLGAQVLAATITASGPTTFCAGGSVTLSGNNDGGTWSNNSVATSIVVTTAGDYTITNTNVCGSATSAILTVVVNPLPVAATITTTNGGLVCSGGNVVLSGNNGGTWSIGGATTASITVSAAGDYFVTTTNGCGTVTSNHIAVTTGTVPTAAVITAGGASTICAGDNLVLSGNVGGTWSNGATTPTITVTAAGDYSVVNTNTCGTATSNHLVVAVTPATGATVFTAGATVLCIDAANETYTATAVNSTSIVYTVNPSTAGVINATTGVMNWDAVFSGTATVTATSTGTCGTTSADRVVSVNSTIGATVFTTGAITVCQNAADETYTATAVNSNTVAYSVLPANAGVIIAATGIMNWDAAFSGTAIIKATSTNNCGTTNAERVVTINPLPTASVITAGGAIILCGTDKVILSGNVGGTWSTGATTATITVTAAGDYSVTNTNACGTVTSNHIIVSVSTIPTASVITAGGAKAICAGGNVVLSGNVNGTWSNGATTPTIIVTAAGDYSVTNTNTCGSATSNVIVVTVNPVPVASTIAANGATALCTDGSVILSGNNGGTWSTGATTNSITVTAAGNYSVINTNACGEVTSNIVVVTTSVLPAASVISAGGAITFCEGGSVILTGNVGGTWSNGETTASITVSKSGDYFVTNEYSCGSVSSNKISVKVNPLPVASILTADGALALCTAEDVVLSGNAGGTWSNSATTAAITVTAAGNYFVTNTNACGSVTSNHMVVTLSAVKTASVITASGALAICADDSLTLSGNNGGTWSNGKTTAAITVHEAGDYYVTNDYSCGSVTSNHLAVTVGPLPLALTITAGSATALCAADIVVLSGNSGGVWSTGATTATISVSLAGDYYVTTTNACGSVTSNHIVVTTGVVPAVSTISAGGSATTFCEGENVVLSGNSDGVWSNGAITATITVTESGDYYVTNATSCGTETSNHIVVTVNPLPTAATISADGTTTFCGIGSVILSGNVDGIWNNGKTTTDLVVTSTGNYFVTNTNNCGSVTSNHIAVKVNSLATASVITADGLTTICEGENVILSGNIGGIWSNGATTAAITVVASGDYFVTNTNNCGDVTSDTIIVLVKSLPVASVITANRALVLCDGQNVILSGNIGGVWSNAATTETIKVVDAGDYFVTNANSCGSLTSNHMIVTVIASPSTASNQIACVGNAVSYKVGDVAGLTYQWRRGSNNLVDGGNISGATTPTLTINPVKINDAATNYNVVITGPCSPYTASAYLSLVVNTEPEILGQPYNQNACLNGCEESFLVVAIGTDLTYQWRRGTVNLSNGGNISGATSAKLTFSTVNYSDTASDYNVVVTGTCNPSSVSDDVSLQICGPTSVKSAVVPSNSVAIYPNPFSKSISVEINNASKISTAQIRLYNSLGEEVMVSTVNKPVTLLQTANLPVGVYYYKVISKNKTIQTGKLISVE
jgi:hypothetical protein